MSSWDEAVRSFRVPFRQVSGEPVSPPLYVCSTTLDSYGGSTVQGIDPRVVLGSHLLRCFQPPVAFSCTHIGSNHTGQQCQRSTIAIRTGPNERWGDTRRGTDRYLYFVCGQTRTTRLNQDGPKPTKSFHFCLWRCFCRSGTPQQQLPHISSKVHEVPNGWCAWRSRPSRTGGNVWRRHQHCTILAGKRLINPPECTAAAILLDFLCEVRCVVTWMTKEDEKWQAFPAPSVDTDAAEKTDSHETGSKLPLISWEAGLPEKATIT